MYRKTIVVSLIALFFLASAFAASGDKAKAKGMIIARAGETLVVETTEGKVTVVLTDGTTTKDDKGLFGLEKQQMSNVVLIPGLKVDVDGTSDEQGRVVAKTITLDGDDLETAELIQAGLHPTAEQVAANVRSIETNRGDIASNKVQLAAQKENIGTNQQNIAGNGWTSAKEEIGDKINFLDCEIEALLQSGIIKNSLQVGQKAPDFTLPNAIGGEVSLSSLLKKGPVVLSFYRGDPATLSTDLSALLIAHSACNVRFEEPYEFDCVGR